MSAQKKGESPVMIFIFMLGKRTAVKSLSFVSKHSSFFKFFLIQLFSNDLRHAFKCFKSDSVHSQASFVSAVSAEHSQLFLSIFSCCRNCFSTISAVLVTVFSCFSRVISSQVSCCLTVQLSTVAVSQHLQLTKFLFLS